MKRLVLVLLALCVLSVAHVPCNAQKYGKELEKTWRNILGIDENRDGKYRWFGYPVDNFGVLTAYDPPTNRDWIDSDRICATWRCIEQEQNIPNDMAARLSVNNMADAGTGGAITLDEDKQKKIGLNLLLPGLGQLLNLGANLKWDKDVKTTLTIDRIHKRSADRDRYRQFIQNTSTNQTLKTAFTNGRLAWIASDIVAEGVKMSITVNVNKNAAVDAALTKAVGTVLSPDSKLGFQWSKQGVGQYTLVISHPVVLAVQTRRQPSAGTLTTGASAGEVYNKPLPRPQLVLANQ